MALTIDEDNPCAAAKTLREVYIRLVAGQAAATVSFSSGPSGVSRSATYHAANPDRLLMVIRGFEQKCAALRGLKPARRAVATGGVR